MSTHRLLSFALLAAALSLLGAPGARAQTPLSGNVFDGSGGPLLSGVVYHATSTLTVPSGQTLTVQPGAIVKFNGTGLNVDGTLNAVGTSGSKIIFTCLRDDAAGGDTNADGATPPGPDQWVGLSLSPTADASHLKFVEIRYTGAGFSPALRLTTCDALVENCTFRDGQHGLLTLGNDSFPTVSNCSFINCGDVPPIASVHVNALPGLHANSVSGTGAGLFVSVGAGTPTADVTITTDNLLNNCVVTGSFSIPAGRKMTIGSGVFMKVLGGTAISVDGTLVTNGTQASPVVITTVPDDSYGGDHNNNGPSSGAPDTWCGITFNATAGASTLTNTIVRYSGAGFSAALEINGADIVCTDCLLRDGAHSAVDLNGVAAHPQFIRCAFQDNQNNATANIPIVAVPGFVDCLALGSLPGQYLRVTNGTVSSPTVIHRYNAIGGAIVLANHLIVPPGQTLTLHRGVVFKMENAYQVAVDGSLIVDADGADPVVFTTLPDDEFGGDTNMNGPSSGSPDTWVGLNFNSASGPSSIKGLRVRYSGAGFSPGINFSSATTTAREVRTDSCQHDGIRLIALQGVARDFTTFACSDAGIRVLNNATAIQNATIVNTNGTGIFNSGGFTGSITNTILWGNTAEFSGVTSPMVSWSDTSTYAGSNNNVNANPAFVNQAAGDLRLTAASPCIDAGDPTFGAASGDAGGAPRLTDGNLDGARRIDIGAHEFTNVGLAISGVAQPGGTLTISTTGTAGLPVLFLAGLDGEQEVTPYGTLFVNLALPHLLIAYGTVPSTIPALVPANFPVPFDLAFQEIVAQGSKANFSNVVHLHFTQP